MSILSKAERRMSVSERRLPVERDVDVLIVGGTVSAVAAAVAAAGAGARVFLAAPRLFLGEDLCSTLRLWRQSESSRGPLADAMLDGAGWATPLKVKRTLEGAMLAAGADFVLGAMPVGVLEGADGSLAGVVLATRAGRQAVVARAVLDGTMNSLVGELAGCLLRQHGPFCLAARRVVLGGEMSRLAPVRSQLCEQPNGGEPLAYHEYELDLPVPAWTPAALQEAEQAARDLTHRPGQLRAAECLYLSSREPWQAVSGLSRLDPSAGEVEARDIGVAIAAGAKARVLGEARVRCVSGERLDGVDLAEGLRGFRPAGEPAATVSAADDSLPVLARVQVLVVGGGTAGAAAGIAAARAGARTLVLEYQEALGGVGTVGLIGAPYHGQNVGFAAEAPFPDDRHSIEYKMEWLRRELRQAGGTVWLGSLAFGACCRDRTVRGAAVATPYGCGVVLADVTIDATGNADVAAAAGAATVFGDDPHDIALQGTGISIRPPGRDCVNSDYLLVDDSDVVDVTCAMVGSRQAVDPAGVYDTLPFVQSRERRRVVADHTLRYLDQLLGRTYSDTIATSLSDYDSHGYPSAPYFALLPHNEQTRRENHPAPGGMSDTPYRSLLPMGLDGMLVVGLGTGMERDACALMRMQRDLLNQGYAAGLAATEAAARGISPKKIDIRMVQRKLVAIGALRESVLLDNDSPPTDPGQVERAVEEFGDASLDYDRRSRALAMVLANAQTSLPAVRLAFVRSEGSQQHLAYAALLGFAGQADGVAVLSQALAVSTWDDKIAQGRMAEYSHLPTPVDSLVLALGYARDPRAIDPILAKLSALDANATLSHHRAVALALEHLADRRAAEPLAALLAKPGMCGHVMTGIEPLFDQPTEKRRREGSLREIVLARALLACGDHQGFGRRTIESYCRDVRGLFARHAKAVLTATDGEHP